jgi:poly-gamma-glutamate synthesis protein (capsule biosynthesis protein)
MNRPGIPPIIVTWADADSLRAFTDDVAALRARSDIVIASCHWGLGKDTLNYMRDIGHAAIDAGADIVIGHGPHYSLAVESYRGKPIFYGLGSFSFHTGHGGRAHGDWVGMMVRADVERDGPRAVRFQFVRHNAENETVPCALADEHGELADIIKRSAEYGTRLEPVGDEVNVVLEVHDRHGPA